MAATRSIVLPSAVTAAPLSSGGSCDDDRTLERLLIPTLRRSHRPALAASALLVVLTIGLVGCDSGDLGRAPQAARPAEENSQSFGNLEVHYNALRTDELTPDVARAYGIERSGNRVLLNVSLLAKSADGANHAARRHGHRDRAQPQRAAQGPGDAPRAGRPVDLFHRRGRHQRQRDPRLRHRRRRRPTAAAATRCSSSASSSATEAPQH